MNKEMRELSNKKKKLNPILVQLLGIDAVNINEMTWLVVVESHML